MIKQFKEDDIETNCEFFEYVFLYTDGTADYFSASDVLNGNVELKHFDMENIVDIFNVGVKYENAGGYIGAVAVQYDGTASLLIYRDGVLKLED